MGVANIVCGVTGSTHAQKAALEAALLAKKEDAGLVYVYAVDVTFFKGGLGHTGAVEASLVKLGGQIVDLAEQIALAHGIRPRKIVRKGPVLEVLKQVIVEEKADLLEEIPENEIGLNQSQNLVAVTQPIITGGKRGLGIRVSEKAKEKNEFERDTVLLNVIADTKKAFYGVIGDQEGLAIAKETEKIAKGIYESE